MNNLTSDHSTPLTLEELINTKLDETENDQMATRITSVRSKKKKNRKKYVEEESESSDSEPYRRSRSKKCHKKWFAKLSTPVREAVIIFLLFVLFSSRLATGQADRLLKIQVEQYSVYDLMARGIAMTLLFFIFCRLFAMSK